MIQHSKWNWESLRLSIMLPILRWLWRHQALGALLFPPVRFSEAATQFARSANAKSMLWPVWPPIILNRPISLLTFPHSSNTSTSPPILPLTPSACLPSCPPLISPPQKTKSQKPQKREQSMPITWTAVTGWKEEELRSAEGWSCEWSHFLRRRRRRRTASCCLPTCQAPQPLFSYTPPPLGPTHTCSASAHCPQALIRSKRTLCWVSSPPAVPRLDWKLPWLRFGAG